MIRYTPYFLMALCATSMLNATQPGTSITMPEANITHPLYPNTAIYDSHGPLGKYLIAGADIPKGTIVAKFEGPISTDCFHRHSKWVKHNEKGESECMHVESSAVYVNHSCEPNSEVHTNDWSISTVTDIKKGQAITISYNNPNYFPANLAWDPAWNFDCHCNADNCPKKIDGWLANKSVRGE